MRTVILCFFVLSFLFPALAEAQQTAPPLILEELTLEANGDMTFYLNNTSDETLHEVVVKIKGRNPDTQEMMVNKVLKVGSMAPKLRKKYRLAMGPNAFMYAYEADFEFRQTVPQVSDIIGNAVPAGVEVTDDGYLVSGSGSSLVEDLPMPDGSVTFRLHFEGEGDFSILLLDASGQPVKTLAEREAPYRGYVNYSTVDGSYALDVTAQGAWSITVVTKRSAPSSPTGPIQMDSEDGVLTITN